VRLQSVIVDAIRAWMAAKSPALFKLTHYRIRGAPETFAIRGLAASASPSAGKTRRKPPSSFTYEPWCLQRFSGHDFPAGAAQERERSACRNLL
jgi:hypothetical protein